MHMLASLLQHSLCAVCITDARQADMPIVHVNSIFEQATGYSAAEVTSGCDACIAAPCDSDQVHLCSPLVSLCVIISDAH